MKLHSLDGLTLSLACFINAIISGTMIAGELGPEKAAEFIGVKECAACHSSPSPIYKQLGITAFVRLVEASDWLQNDKHAYAFQLVRQNLSEVEIQSPDHQSNLRSIEICKKLGWTTGDGNFEKQCLTCHAGVDHRTNSKLDPDVLQFGVQCESCHGAGSNYTRLEHHQQVAWRGKTPKDKAALGMNDLSSASVAAQVCYSCHMGDLEQNRFVTHPMYAAGHPPLPPVDLQVFMEAMPPHWKGLHEKPYTDSNGEGAQTTFAMQKEYFEAHFGAGRGTDADIQAWRTSYHRTQKSMIGGFAANDVGLRLIHSAANQAELWGDFAIYDCAGCHHELSKSNPRWRPFDRTPGRAYPAMWWNLDAKIETLQDQDSPSETTKNFFAAFDRVPFGDRLQLQSLKSAHLDEFNMRRTARQAFEQKPMTEQDVRTWLIQLYKNRKNMLGDYWTAKQTAWMFQVAVKELVAHQAIPENPSLQKLEELSKELNLDLRLDQKASVLANQERILAKANSFNSKNCQQLIDELVQIITP